MAFQVYNSNAVLGMSRLHLGCALLICFLSFLCVSYAACPGTLFIKRSANTRVLAIAFDAQNSSRVLGELLDTEVCTSGLSSDGELFCCLTLRSTSLRCWNLTLGAALVRTASSASPLRLPTTSLRSDTAALSISKQLGAICTQVTIAGATTLNCTSWPQVSSTGSSSTASTVSYSSSQVPYINATIGSWNRLALSNELRPISAWTLRPSDTTTSPDGLYSLSAIQSATLYISSPFAATAEANNVNFNLLETAGTPSLMALSTQRIYVIAGGNVYADIPGSNVQIGVSNLGSLHSLASSRCSDIIGSFVSPNNSVLSFKVVSPVSNNFVASSDIFDFPASWISLRSILPDQQPTYTSATGNWSNVRYAWGSSVSINPVLIHGSSFSCEGPNPDIYHFNCINGSWVSDGDIVTETITIGASPVVVNGSFSSNGTLVFQGASAAPITIVGCVNLNSSEIVITLTSEQVEALVEANPKDRTRLLLSFNQSICDNANTSIIPLSIRLTNPKKCDRKVSARVNNEIQSKGTLSAIFNVSNSTCRRWWIPLVAVLASVFVVILIIALIFTFNPSARECIRPYSKRR